MNHVWKRAVLAAAGILVLSIAPGAFATDFTRFLVKPQLHQEPERISAPAAGTGLNDELYLAKDGFGNRFHVQLKNPDASYFQVSSSILAESLGLPNLPVYPILLQRRGRLLPGTVQSEALAVPYAIKGLSPKQRAELYGHALLHTFLGNSDLELGRGEATSIGFTGEHFVTTGFPQTMQFDQQAPVNRGWRALQSLDEALVRGLKPEATAEFLAELNRYLTRLEALSPADWERMFGPTLQAVAKAREYAGEPELPFMTYLQQRAKEARRQVLQHLKSAGIPKTDLQGLQAALPLPPPHVRLPSAMIAPLPIPEAAKHAPVELLWSLYFESSPKARETMGIRWAAELESTPQNVLERLTRRSQNDTSRLDWVAPHMEPDLYRYTNDALPQVHLNSSNRDMLFVVPTNDREAAEIGRMAKESGAKVLWLDRPHGAKLAAEEADEIIAEAKRRGARRIVVVELPRDSRPGPKRLVNGEAKILKEGFELIPVDHHDYAGGLARWNPLSSLEQAAEILGYHLAPTEKALGVRDRSGMHGLLDLGVSRKELKHFMRERHKPGTDFSVPPAIETPEGKLYVLRNTERHPGELSSLLALHDYPRIPNILLLNSRERFISFNGNSRTVGRLRALAAKHEDRSRANWAGGDPARSRFWGMNGIEKELYPALENEVLELVQRELNAPRVSGCVTGASGVAKMLLEPLD